MQKQGWTAIQGSSSKIVGPRGYGAYRTAGPFWSSAVMGGSRGRGAFSIRAAACALAFASLCWGASAISPFQKALDDLIANVDRTGEMPNLPKPLGEQWYSPMCWEEPTKLREDGDTDLLFFSSAPANTKTTRSVRDVFSASEPFIPKRHGFTREAAPDYLRREEGRASVDESEDEGEYDAGAERSSGSSRGKDAPARKPSLGDFQSLLYRPSRHGRKLQGDPAVASDWGPDVDEALVWGFDFDQYNTSESRALLRRSGAAAAGERARIRKLKKDWKRQRQWKTDHPKQVDFDLLAGAYNSRNDFCPWMIKRCIKPDIAYRWDAKPGPMFCKQYPSEDCAGIEDRLFNKEINSGVFFMSNEEWQTLPDIPVGAWGSCALVGLGDNLLEHEKGEEIDNHDVVIRMARAPMKGFEKYIGTRTDVLATRSDPVMMRGRYKYNDVRLYLYQDPNGNLPGRRAYKKFRDPTDPKAKRLKKTGRKGKFKPVAEKRTWKPQKGVQGLHTFPCDIENGQTKPNMCLTSPTRSFSDEFFNSMTDPMKIDTHGKKNVSPTKRIRPTSGFTILNDILYSGICKRLDVYGLSTNCAGMYYDRSRVMKDIHSCELESYVNHYRMQTYPDLGLCVYL